MTTLTRYDFEPLIGAVSALDWSNEHPTCARQTLQAVVLRNYGDELSIDEAIHLMCHLIEQNLIKTRIHPDDLHCAPGWHPPARRAKYVRVPPAER